MVVWSAFPCALYGERLRVPGRLPGFSRLGIYYVYDRTINFLVFDRRPATVKVYLALC